ncbi:hypothetical protein [Pedobacter alpinus]|uniref:Uncharacterized protein n=1 Tax=Pedobacter alpinus TaxID=1590643 RepID=A0ABW5TSY4_9SPHI
MYKKRAKSIEDLEYFDTIFDDVYKFSSNIRFKPTNWNKLVYENTPFIDSRLLGSLMDLMRITNSQGLLIMPILVHNSYLKRNVKKYECIDFDYLPAEEEFSKASSDEYYDATGGVVMSKCGKIAA